MKTLLLGLALIALVGAASGAWAATESPSDYGDAPDARPAGYTGTGAAVVGRFPSRLSSDGARHGRAGALRLGAAVSVEGESRQVDLDVADDGVFVELTSCARSTVKVLVDASRLPASTRVPGHSAYLNAWFDWNRDGDWADEDRCGPTRVPEHRVENLRLDLGQFASEAIRGIEIPIVAGREVRQLWYRATLTLDEPVRLADGRGRFEHGETEDHLQGKTPTVYCPAKLGDHGGPIPVAFVYPTGELPTTVVPIPPNPPDVKIQVNGVGGFTATPTKDARSGAGRVQVVQPRFRFVFPGGRVSERPCRLTILHGIPLSPLQTPGGGRPGTVVTGFAAKGSWYVGAVSGQPAGGTGAVDFRISDDGLRIEDLRFNARINCTRGPTSDLFRFDLSFLLETRQTPLPSRPSVLERYHALDFDRTVTVLKSASAGSVRGRLQLSLRFGDSGRTFKGTLTLTFQDPNLGACTTGTVSIAGTTSPRPVFPR